MRQVWIVRTGPPETLALREAPDPVPQRGEIRIRVKAVGVNFAEVMARKGLYADAPKLPFVPGYEVSGEVDALGSDVIGLKVGDRVLAATRFGAYSDVVCVPAGFALPLPDGMSFAAGAALPVNYLTAQLLVEELARVRRGDKVLIHGIGGGVGIAALQLCKAAGAEVIGTASAGKHARLRKMGVEHLIDYRTLDFEEEVKRITKGRGVNAAFDPLGGSAYVKSYRCLAPLGRLVMYGIANLSDDRLHRRLIAGLQTMLLPVLAFHPVRIINENKGVMGLNAGHLWDRMGELRRSIMRLMEATVEGTCAPVIDRVFPLAEAAEAHHYLEARRNFGKVLLAP